MKRKMCVAFVLLCCAIVVFAEEPPIAGGGWYWEDGINLNGRWFSDVAPSFCEQDGWAIVQGKKLHYWLYDTYTYWDGYGESIINQYVPAWIERMGYVIDFDNIQKSSPNNNLAASVKALMKQRDCDVSVTLCTKQNYGANVDFVVINNYDKSDGSYLDNNL